MGEKIKPVHPGEILKEEFLNPMGISQYKLAKDIDVSEMTISQLVNKKRSITTDTALRLAKYFGVSPAFWLGIQNDYDIETKKDNEDFRQGLDKIQPLLSSI
jgi:antitoxin HigA-1